MLRLAACPGSRAQSSSRPASRPRSRALSARGEWNYLDLGGAGVHASWHEFELLARARARPGGGGGVDPVVPATQPRPISTHAYRAAMFSCSAASRAGVPAGGHGRRCAARHPDAGGPNAAQMWRVAAPWSSRVRFRQNRRRRARRRAGLRLPAIAATLGRATARLGRDLETPRGLCREGNLSTLQGEGGQAGRAAVFRPVRGPAICGPAARPTGPPRNAVFCEHRFRAPEWHPRPAPNPSARDLADAIAEEWAAGAMHRFVVLQPVGAAAAGRRRLARCLHERCFAIAVETNGSDRAARGPRLICVSPKAGAELRIRAGPGAQARLSASPTRRRGHFRARVRRFLRCSDGRAPSLPDNTARAVD